MVKAASAMSSRLRRPRLSSWRAVVSLGLVLAYVVLVGEAIHCQYVPPDHTAHHESSAKPSNHSTHCLLANHASATLPALAWFGVDSLPSLGAVRLAEAVLGELATVSFSPARAPPFASLS